MPPTLITLEEHFLSIACGDSLNALYSEQFKAIPGLED